MSSIIVCGGSVIGMSVAMMLADDGHQVTVLEQDSGSVPGSATQAWEGWERRGVGQFHQPHVLLARVRQVFDAELPGMIDALLDAGCVWVDPIDTMPPFIEDRSRRDDDDRFRSVTGRRPTVEAVVAAQAGHRTRLSIRRGVTVAALLTGPAASDEVPHVVGVRTATGEELRADLVIDATGRRSKLPDWLAGIGAADAIVEVEDAGFVYYTRFYKGPDRPAVLGPQAALLGTFSLLTLVGDNDTWSITMSAFASDAALRRFRDVDCFTRVVAACPLYAHWLDGEPMTDVLMMGGVLDKYRRFVVDGLPVVTGVAVVGDAWACTNPSAGRGISIGLIHAQQLRRVVRAGIADPMAFALAWDEVTEAVVAPFYRDQLAADRARAARVAALSEGRTPPPLDPTIASFQVAAASDPEVFRALMETMHCLALPRDVLARPDIEARVATKAGQVPPMLPGPDRDELLALVG